jgi:hypothetical protein
VCRIHTLDEFSAKKALYECLFVHSCYSSKFVVICQFVHDLRRRKNREWNFVHDLWTRPGRRIIFVHVCLRHTNIDE